MFDLKTWLTGVGIALTIAGGVLVWKFSPTHFSVINGNVTNTADRDRRVDRQNRLLSAGGLLLLVGAVLQLIANFLPAG